MFFKSIQAIENSLFILIKGDDKKAFDQLFLKYYSDLCRFAITFLNESDEAEDVVQKIFIRLWENRNKLIIPKNEKAFLYRSVYNECLNSVRNKNTRERNYLQYFLELDTSPSEQDPNPEIHKIVNRSINNLPVKCQEIFILNKIEGLTQKEISEYMGISAKTVENQVANAISKLRVELKPILHLLPAGLIWFL